MRRKSQTTLAIPSLTVRGLTDKRKFPGKQPDGHPVFFFHGTPGSSVGPLPMPQVQQ